jgi:hypothetical protein
MLSFLLLDMAESFHNKNLKREKILFAEARCKQHFIGLTNLERFYKVAENKNDTK